MPASGGTGGKGPWRLLSCDARWFGSRCGRTFQEGAGCVMHPFADSSPVEPGPLPPPAGAEDLDEELSALDAEVLALDAALDRMRALRRTIEESQRKREMTKEEETT